MPLAGAAEGSPSGGTAAAGAAATYPLNSIPALHSRPGAFAKLYLDFDGDTTATWGTYSPGTTPAYDTDGSVSSFSDTELANIREIWARVAEKYSPFNIDVTTADPGNLNDGETLRVVIGGNGAWSGSLQGGTAYVGGFYSTSPNTVFVFEDNLGNGDPRYTAENSAHEAGHGFGLRHQNQYNGNTFVAEYNPGDSLRGPIMGESKYSARGLWWLGPTSLFNSPVTQDDLAILSSTTDGFGYRTDDHGGSAAAATALTLSGTSASASGVIEQMTDSDWFRFTTAAGTVSFTVNVAQYGAMLDAKVELRDAAGNLVTSADTSSLGETITANVAAGTYYLVVASHGSYGDVGQYTVSGTIVTGALPAAPVANAGGPYSVGEGQSLTLSGAGSTGTGLTYAWDLDGDGVYGETGAGATRGSETGVSPVFSAAGLDGNGSYTVGLRVTDSAGQTSTAAVAITITNIAPTSMITGAASVNEGSPYTLGLSATDPGLDTISSWVINWGDGSAAQTVTGNPSSVTHTYADNGNYTISATVTDEDGTYSVGSKSVAVADVAPTIALGGAASVNEGSAYALTLGAVTDPGADTVTQYVVNWGDGTADVYASAAGAKSHVYADGTAARTISVTLVNEDGTFTAAGTRSLTVNNVAPTLTLSGAGSVNEGSLYTLGLAVSDPGQDTITGWVINWGDGSAAQAVAGNLASVTHTYLDNGAYTVSATATDEDGTYSATAKTVSVLNVAPTLTISGAASGFEGSLYTLGLTSADPGPDTISKWTINWGDGTAAQVVTGNPSSVTHAYADNGSYTVTATATDEDGTFGANAKAVSVLNVAPTIALTGAASVNEGSAYSLTLGAVTDPGADTIAQYVVNWGDGTSDVYTTAAGAKAHTYADGTAARTISVTLIDEDGTFAGAGTLGLTVNNVAPTLALSGAGAVSRGAVYTLGLASSDPGQDTITSWVIDWGDGTAAQTVTGNPSSVTHTYAAAGNVTISATATDEDGTYGATTKSLSVAAVVPTVALGGAATVNEGSAYTLTLGAVSNATGTVTQYSVDWGDGTTDVYTTAGAKTHTYADGTAARTIAVGLTDGSGTYASVSTLGVTVNNVAPTLTLSGAASVNEGSPYTLGLLAADPGVDTISRWVINWGDGTAAQTVTGNPSSVTHTYADNGSYTVSATATDEDGTYAAPSRSVAVANVAPRATVSGAATANEGAPYALTIGAVTDPGADTVAQFVVNWGDGTTETFATAGVKTHVFADGPVAARNVAVSLVDEDGTFAAGGVTVNVADVAPTVTINGAPSVSKGSPYNLVLSVTDSGADTVSSWQIDWGDGTIDTVAGNPPTATHTYAATGTYAVSARVTNEDGTFNSNAISLTVPFMTVNPPAIALSGPAAVDEGSPYAVELGALTEIAEASVTQYVVHWGDGTTSSYATRGPKTHTYANGLSTPTISVDLVTAGRTYTAAGAWSLTVRDVAPRLSVAGADSATAGAAYSVSLASSDPGADLLSAWSVDWGDGTTQTLAGDATTASHTYATAGAYTVSAAATDDSGTYVVGIGAVTVAAPAPPPDVTAPTASLSAAGVSAATTAAYTFSVTWSDDRQVDVSTLDDADVLVTGPNGFSRLARLVSVGGNSASRVATYALDGPGGSWDAADNGTYTVLVQPSQVTDAAGNAVAAGPLGTFAVKIADPKKSDLTGHFTGRSPGKTLGGAKGAAAVVVVNEGQTTASGPVATELYLSADGTLDAGDRLLSKLTKKLTLKTGKSAKLAFKFAYPKDLSDGNYYLLARVDAADAVAERSEDNNIVAWSAPVPIVRPVADLTGRSRGAASVSGDSLALPLELTNGGVVDARGPLEVTVVVSADATFDAGDLTLGTLSKQTVQLKLKPGKTALYTLSAAVPAGLPAGTYHLFAVIDSGNVLAEASEANNLVSFGEVTGLAA